MSSVPSIVERGKSTDLPTALAFQFITGAPVISVLSALHFETLGVRVLRTDSTGRLFVNPGTAQFQVVNIVLLNTMQNVITGAPIFRRITFYAFNANASLQFQLVDTSLTSILTIVPNVPLIVEGVFIGAQAQNAAAGVTSTLEAVIGQDPLQGS